MQKLKLLALTRLAMFALSCSVVAWKLSRDLQEKARTLADRLLASA